MNWKRVNLLDMVELYAEDNNMISSEAKLSEVFDEDVAQNVIEQYGADDTVAMNEAFNDWTDMLCKDGVIHEVQYSEYCYVGKYSGD